MPSIKDQHWINITKGLKNNSGKKKDDKPTIRQNENVPAKQSPTTRTAPKQPTNNARGFLAQTSGTPTKAQKKTGSTQKSKYNWGDVAKAAFEVIGEKAKPYVERANDYAKRQAGRPGGTYDSKKSTPTQTKSTAQKSTSSLQMVTSKTASNKPLSENMLKEEKARAERAKRAQEANAKKKQQQAEANERNRQAALAKKQKEQQEKAKREAYNRAFYASKKKKNGGKNK